MKKYICFIQHPGSNREYLFDCTEIHNAIPIGTMVVCDTRKGIAKGKVVSLPIQITDSSDDGAFGTAHLLCAAGARLPLKKVLRVLGNVDLLAEEIQQIIRREGIKIVDGEDLPTHTIETVVENWQYCNFKDNITGGIAKTNRCGFCRFEKQRYYCAMFDSFLKNNRDSVNVVFKCKECINKTVAD